MDTQTHTHTPTHTRKDSKRVRFALLICLVCWCFMINDCATSFYIFISSNRTSIYISVVSYLYMFIHACISLLLLMCAFVQSSFTDLCAQRYYTQLPVTRAAVHPIPTCAPYMRRIKSYMSWFAAVCNVVLQKQECSYIVPFAYQ